MQIHTHTDAYICIYIINCGISSGNKCSAVHTLALCTHVPYNTFTAKPHILRVAIARNKLVIGYNACGQAVWQFFPQLSMQRNLFTVRDQYYSQLPRRARSLKKIIAFTWARINIWERKKGWGINDNFILFRPPLPPAIAICRAINRIPRRHSLAGQSCGRYGGKVKTRGSDALPGYQRKEKLTFIVTSPEKVANIM